MKRGYWQVMLACQPNIHLPKGSSCLLLQVSSYCLSALAEQKEFTKSASGAAAALKWKICHSAQTFIILMCRYHGQDQQRLLDHYPRYLGQLAITDNLCSLVQYYPNPLP